MEAKPDRLAAALTALNENLVVTTAALDVGTKATAAAYNLSPKFGDALLEVVKAVLAARDEAVDAAILAATKRSMEDWNPLVRGPREPVQTLDDRMRAIVREEIIADRVLFGGVWQTDPDAAIYMAVSEKRIKDERLAPILEALLDGDATALKYETRHGRTEG